MNKQDFKDLIGESPEDVLGNDWENTVGEYAVFKNGGINKEHPIYKQLRGEAKDIADNI